MYYKVFIPSAGLGTRLGNFSKNLNKALVSLDNKPVISHVIEKFPKHVELVIALGHKGELLKEYLEIAHSDRNITLVNIENYQGRGAGLGLTLLECKDHLQCPFIFCPNDTLILEDIPEPLTNWVGFSNVENNNNYRSFQISGNNLVEKIHEKNEILSLNSKPYIGLAGVKDYEDFWSFMEIGRKYGSIKAGESYGLNELIKNNSKIEAKEFTWYDTANIRGLEKAKKIFLCKDSPEILEKANEAIWFVNNRVIKYNNDPSFISERVERSGLLRGYVPEIVSQRKHMYSYRMLTGQVVSRITNHNVFESLLGYLDFFWQAADLDEAQTKKFNDTCDCFYREKTFGRVQTYFNRFSEHDEEEVINGIETPKVFDLLNKVPWDYLARGFAVRMHGDLHFENILMAETGEFYLLDWRQNFGGIVEYGDVYYDLAKLLHGLIVSHELINKECFSVKKIDNIIDFDLYRKNSLINNQHQLFSFVGRKGYDLNKVNLLTSLIFLNIAALHHDPYSKMLFYLGKEMLFKNLEANNGD